MTEATDQQMQTYADERVRRRAEEFRALVIACRDDKLAIDDIYERSVGASPWADAREDGPPNLLTQQDMLVFNAIITNFIAILDGSETGSQSEIEGQRSAYIAAIRSNWAVFQSACVRPVND